jgi:tetratricopeptide (TPR) repeat protein
MADKARAANDESAEIQYSQRCIEDDDRHTELSHRYRTGVAGLGSSGRNLCLRVAGRHTQALSEAISATEVNPCSESFLVLSYCYEDMGNRSEAIKAATRALAVAKNDYYRNRAQERIGSLRT